MVLKCKTSTVDESDEDGNMLNDEECDEKDDDENYSLQAMMLGGDQLSTSMARRVIADRVNSTNDVQSLKGLLPVVEDWLAKLCCLVV